jgi:hypothetical protein
MAAIYDGTDQARSILDRQLTRTFDIQVHGNVNLQNMSDMVSAVPTC